MFNSLRARLWLTYALVVGVALTVIALGLLAYLVRNPLLYRQAVVELHLATAEVNARLTQVVNLPETRRQEALTRIDKTLNARIVILTADGTVKADSRPEQSQNWSWPLPEPATTRLETFRTSDGQVWMYDVRKAANGFFLLAMRPRPKISLLNILADDLMPQLLRAAAVALLLALLMAWGVTRWVVAPLQHLSKAALDVAAGKYQPIAIQGPNEVRTLGETFNIMAARVQASLQSQRDFVANVSHELKTPLTSIQGFAQALLDGTAESLQNRQQAAQVIYDEAGRMHRLVSNLLDLARFDAGTVNLKRAPVEISALLQTLVTKFTPQCKQVHVILEVQSPPHLALVGDVDRLSQVFTNLIDNALQHTPVGGQVRLEAHLEKNMAVISVQDTGPGISPDIQKRIFERFYQADPSRSSSSHGAGLGLAIAHEIIQAHGGSLSVKSSLGQGAIFVVKLPTVRPDDTTLISRKN